MWGWKNERSLGRRAKEVGEWAKFPMRVGEDGRVLDRTRGTRRGLGQEGGKGINTRRGKRGGKSCHGPSAGPKITGTAHRFKTNKAPLFNFTTPRVKKNCALTRKKKKVGL